MFVLASNHFWKYFFVNAGVWLHMENKFSGNYLQLTECFEGFDPEMVWSENFHFKPFPDSRPEREPSTSTSLITAFDFDFADLRSHRSTNRSRLQLRQPLLRLRRLRQSTNRSSTQSLRPTNLWLRRRPRAFAPQTDLRPFAFDPEPWTHEPISLYVILIFCVMLIDPQTHEPLISDFVVVAVVWVVVFWWFFCCAMVGFVWVVVENNIFRRLPSTWKYFLEQFL